ncbi:MAG: prolyl oligopeptidase family serine peptidase [Gemmatimonadales bacterium]|nr:prolyl oligopeptidase family serine peptidase [Gemmatimonadales bacterium]
MNSVYRAGLRRFLPFAAVILLAAPLAAQETAEDPANYRLAARFAPYKIQDLVYSTSVDPQWIEGSESFWYEWETSDGSFYQIVDPVAGTKRQIFDNDRIAAELTRITRDPWDGQHLPIRAIRFIDANTLQFEVESSQDEEEDETESEMEELDEEEEEGERQRQRARKKVFHFEYDVNTRVLRELEDREAPDNHPSWASVSPDGQTVIFARDHNLHMMSGDDYRQFLEARRGKSGDEADEAEEGIEVEETQLTTDGEEHYSYAVFERGDTDIERKENADERKRVSISWARDSRRFSLIRRDRREVGNLWVIHMVGNKRPELESYKYDMPGEETVSQPELLIYDLQDRNTVEVAMPEEWKDHRLFTTSARQFRYPDSEEPFRSLWLSPGSDELHFVRQSRDQHRVDVMVADAATGAARVLFEERLNTYVEFQRLELLESGDMLWWSERDGWAHLYRFGPDGTLRNRLTEGPWSVRQVVGIDESAGVVYFQANAREEGEDPYYQHVYRVNLDGSGLTILNPGDFDHRVEMGESNRFFVSNYSRVNTTPAAALHAANGRRIMDLETADFSKLEEAGYGFPEPYTVKADDGVTDLYGVIYKPFDFDPEKTYPIVAYVYPGPQTEAVAKSFSTARYETALAQFGMIVITVGNRGGHPARSKWYHNYGYGNLRDYGLADKKTAIEQLADRHDFIDIDRVGIYGHSGGGFMSTAAMLVYPDFFKVAVSSSGNHNNDVYNQNWSEKHHGVREVVDDSGNVTFEYEIERNSDLAANLKGRLLLTTGDIDNNVHHAGTHRMAEALIRANKRFDYFVFPGQRHGYGDMSDYWFWLRAEYFVKHLLGDTRWSPDITQLNVEQEQTGSR